MAIINSYNKKRGVTYVYESVSYWDKELKQPRSRRKLIGRRDPSTGEIVPTRKSPNSTVTPDSTDRSTDYATLYRHSQQIIRRKDDLIRHLRKELADVRQFLQKQNKGIDKAIENLKGLESPKEAFHA